MKTIKKTYLFFNVALFAWIAFSWLDVILHNTAPGYTYTNANLIYLLVKGNF